MGNTGRKSNMVTMFRDAGFTLSSQQVDQFWIFYQMLVEKNEEYDLTRLTRFEDIITKHFIDCLYVARLTELPFPLVDIGTGAGFPGIPLKILHPDDDIILAEPRHKRVQFLNEVIDALELENIEVYPHLVTGHSFFQARGVITRALEATSETLQRVHHFLPPGGQVIFMKGPGVDNEPVDAGLDENFTTTLDSDYTLPGTTHQRRLLVFSKISDGLKKTYRVMKEEAETEGLAITSADNKRFKLLKKLVSGDGIRKTGKTLVFGRKLISELWHERPQLCGSLLTYDGYTENDVSFMDIIDEFNRQHNFLVLKKALYNELDIFNTRIPLMEVTIPDIPEWDGTIEEGCTLLLPFQDPANTGAVIRSAVAFGITGIVLLAESANPYHPRSIRASGGTVFKADFYRGPSMGRLAEHVANLPVITLDRNGTPLGEVDFPGKFLLLPGMEGPGLPDELKHDAVSIPISEQVESLNAAVASSIFMYAWRNSL